MAGQQNHTDIINGCKQNDPRSQEKLYKDYYKAMMTICMRYTKNESDAVEVLNSGFFKVFKNIQRYDAGIAGLYAWIRKIVINTCLDFIRIKAGRENHINILDAGDVEIPADILNKMKAAELLALIRELPPSTLGVFNLYVIDGYNHKEISALLGISEGTSKWHLSEARKALQQKIQLFEMNAHG